MDRGRVVDLERELFVDVKKTLDTSTENRDRAAAEQIRARYSKAQSLVAGDHSRFRAVLACRRTGKSYLAGSELVYKCLTVPRANCLYITLTKGSGRAILWSFLKQINQELDLRIHFHNTNLTASFQNGSFLAIVGAENRGELDKIRGQGYDLVIIDECKSFPPIVLDELMKEVIGPALIDRMGRLMLIGTPGAILSGQFYEITESRLGTSSRPWEEKNTPRWKGKAYRWSVHRWGLRDAALSHIYDEAMAMKEAEGWADDHPVWLREYCARWVASDDALVYAYERYGDGRNNWKPDKESDNEFGLPGGHKWHYLLGVDLGFDDPMALVVAAYSDTYPDLFQVWDFKAPHLTVPDIAREIELAKKKFGEFDIVVGDFGGLGKTVFATLEEQYGISIIPAEKSEKLDHIELLNSDFLSGRCKILEDSFLAEELLVLQFDSTGVKEHPGCSNHCCDAFLYLWRWAFHHYYKKKKVEPERGTPEWSKLQDKKAFDEAVMARKKLKESDWWENEYPEIDSTDSFEKPDFWKYLEDL